jgi:hypothetical protein
MEDFHRPVLISMLAHVRSDGPNTATPTGGTSTLLGVPISKVRLEGVIIEQKQMSSGSFKIALDDGTGIISINVGKFANKADTARCAVGKLFAIVGKYKTKSKMTATNLFELPCSTCQSTWIARTASSWSRWW